MLWETKRLYLRRLEQSDLPELRVFFQDEQVMAAWEHIFSDEEISAWIAENLRRNREDGTSYYAVVERSSGQLAGVCGILAEEAGGVSRMSLGYIFRRNRWGRGYAFESASACMEYASRVLRLPEITAQIRPDNLPSRRLAERLGMTVHGEFHRRYRGRDVPHLLYYRSLDPGDRG